MLAWFSGCIPEPEEPPEEEPPCTPDSLEQNDDFVGAARLGDVADSTPSAPSDPPKSQRTELTAHTEADVDWFKTTVQDRGSDGDPNVYVIVSHGYEATVWARCLFGPMTAMVCGVGTEVTDPELSGEACLTAPSAGDIPPQLTLSANCDDTSTDSLGLSIRVRRLSPAQACEKYSLTVGAD